MWHGYICDITEKKTADEQLAQSEERRRLAQEATGVGIWDWDVTNDHLYWDDRMWTMLGYPPQERRLDFNEWRAMLHPDDVATSEHEVQRQVALGNGFAMEFRLRTRDGNWRWILGQGSVIAHNPDGSPQRMMGTHTDIHDLKQAETNLHYKTLELARSNEELEQFAYVVSHDLRQPLRMISSYMQLLEKRLDTLDEDSRQMMNFAADGAVRMNQMLVGLLEYSRVGRMGEPPERFASRDALDEALHFLSPAIKEAGAEITIEGTWPDITAGRNEFTRLLQNLIDNAVKFSLPDQTPVVTVNCTKNDDGYTFSVRDNGIGIDPEQHQRLFKVFQRLHTREQYQGTGIGLALARKIVERHGGRIQVESTGTGTGSLFCFTLPNPDPLPEAFL